MSTEQNDELECMDRLIDVFLEEILTGRKPPDLTQRILAAHRVELDGPAGLEGAAGLPKLDVSSAMGPSSVVNDAIGAGIVPAIPIQPGIGSLTSVPAGNGSTSGGVTTATVSRARQYERQGWLAFALAACAVGVVVILGFVRGQQSPDFPLADGMARPGVELGSNEAGKRNPDSSDSKSNSELAEASQRDSSGLRPPVGEVLELDDLPFGSSSNELVLNPSAAPAGGEPVSVLAADAVTDAIDSQLEAMWQQLEVAPSKAIAADERLARVQSMLTGKGADLGSSSSSTDDEAVELTFDHMTRLVGRELQTGRFGEHWSRLFVNAWLGSQRSAQGAEALESWLAQEISARRPWNEVALQLLDAPLPEEKGDVVDPQSVFLASLAGGENHRLVEKIGASFLNANLKCVRCHDGQGIGRPGTNQSAYWSLVASLKGIDAGNGDSGRWVVDKQNELFSDPNISPSVFFDRPNGVLQAADARLPGGQLWTELQVESPRQALAVWISNSTHFSEATVNTVWSLMFGKPLAPLSSNVEMAGYDQRRELLQYLAAQFKAHDYDLPQLVGWIASTQAFGLEPIRLNHAQWLTLSPAEIDGHQLSELVFAAGPTWSGAQPMELDVAVDAAVRWSKRNGPVETLAQPNLQSTSTGQINVAQFNASDLARLEPDTGFLLHATRPTLAQQSFVSRLLRAKLSWEERVEHIAGLSEHELGSQRVQHLAKVLLEASAGDSRTALLHLLWCVQRQGAS